MIRQDKKTVYVAMSGGVDSSVAAALLKERGYLGSDGRIRIVPTEVEDPRSLIGIEGRRPRARYPHTFNVVGVFMKPWSPEPVSSMGKIKNKILNTKYIIPNTFCMWQKDREDAMRVAAKLEIPLLTWDFSREYKKKVVDYMIREYKSGRTPNPDAMCNREIKFGLFLKRALREGADFIATGHYARIKRTRDTNKKNRGIRMINSQHSHRLFKAKDLNKDQSYFLWTLTQKQLKYCLFPIGNYIKPEVRKLAKKFGLPTADKKDSQGICFVGSLDVKEFLKSRIEPKKGKILDLNGKLIGYHDGVFYYTVGQRHGLDIKDGKGPYFVIKKDLKKNIIYVGKESDLREKTAKITDINWVNNNIIPHFFSNKGHLPAIPAISVDVGIRYRNRPKKAILSKNGDLEFKNSARAITSGQSAVFYKGQELLGGGVIK